MRDSNYFFLFWGGGYDVVRSSCIRCLVVVVVVVYIRSGSTSNYYFALGLFAYSILLLLLDAMHEYSSIGLELLLLSQTDDACCTILGLEL